MLHCPFQLVSALTFFVQQMLRLVLGVATVSVSEYIASNGRMRKCEGFERKRSYSNRCSDQGFPRKDWRKQWKIGHDRGFPSWDMNPDPHEYKCRTLSFAIECSGSWFTGLGYYRGADKSLARPTSRCTLFDVENISFDASLVLYIYIYIILTVLQLW